jgi:uncharacterized protein (DUF302 family)
MLESKREKEEWAMRGVRHTVLTLAAVLVVGAVAALSLGSAVPARGGQEDVVEVVSHKNFDETNAALKNGIKAAGFTVLGDFNYQMMQKMVGRDVAPAEGYNYFRPDLGTPIFANDPRAALEIPLKIAIVTVGGKVMVRYRKAEVLFAGYRGLGDLARKLDGLTEQIVKQATQ